MRQVVYVASSESKQIHVLTINKNGKMTLLQELTLQGKAQSMKIGYNAKYLYVGVCQNFAIITYIISPESKLIQQTITDIPVTPTNIEIDHYGRLLFIPSYHKGNLMVLPINQRGIPQVPIQVIGNLKHPHDSKVSFDNSRLFVPCLGDDSIRVYIINKNGNLTEDLSNKIFTNKNSGPRHLVFSKNNNVFYCLNELDATINVYSAREPYKQKQNIKIFPTELKIKAWAADIHITPNCNHLYASERSTNIIRHFKITSSGEQLLPMEAYSTETQPRSFNIDKSGNFLLVAGQKSDHIIVYKIDSITGDLRALDRYLVGKGPIWITTHEV
ncbi:MAG: beta-propeller fold lactonase family protein [Arsenophonus sp.]